MSANLNTIAAVYGDGGVVNKNPSPIGGTWAWCHVDLAGNRIASAAGVITPALAGVPAITNNLTELLAVIRGMLALPAGWHGSIYSDSMITLGRLFQQMSLKGIPAWLAHDMGAAMRHVDMLACSPVQLDGHPTKKQLAAGIGKRGNPVSAHNVFCDSECNRVKAELL